LFIRARASTIGIFLGVLKELEEKNLIKKSEGTCIIATLGHTIRLLVVKGDGGFNYVSTALGCLWYMLIIIIRITKKPIQLNIWGVLWKCALSSSKLYFHASM
jgi:hypothetical protein